MTVLSLRKIPFHISGQYRAEVTDTAVCTPDTAVQLISLCCPVLFQAHPIDLHCISYYISIGWNVCLCNYSIKNHNSLGLALSCACHQQLLLSRIIHIVNSLYKGYTYVFSHTNTFGIFPSLPKFFGYSFPFYHSRWWLYIYIYIYIYFFQHCP